MARSSLRTLCSQHPIYTADAKPRNYCEGCWRAWIDSGPLFSAAEALATLLRRSNVRWRHHGEGRLTCSCCGSVAHENYDDGVRIVRERAGCSPSCPWKVAEDALAEYGYKF